MTVVASQLSGWNPEELGAAGTALRAASRELSVLAARVAAPNLNRASWTGVAADAAAQHAADARRRFDAMATVLDLSGLQLCATARMLQIARSQLEVAVARAVGAGLVVADDGTVAVPPIPAHHTGSVGAVAASARHAAQVQCADNASAVARAALAAAERADAAAAQALDGAGVVGAHLGASTQAWLALWAASLAGPALQVLMGARLVPWELGSLPARGTDPAVVASWWAGLSPAARDIAVRAHTHHLGVLDGLPGDVRHRANVLALQAGIADARAALASRRRPLTEAVELMSRLKRLEAVAAELSADPVRRRLLLLDDDGHLAAIAIGDVDTADHVAVVVPGLEQDVAEDMDAVVYNADRLAGTADSWLQRLAPGETFAAVAWLGYDTPSFATVASSREAIRGAAALRSTLRGLDVARTAVPTPRGAPSGELHLTVVGHSYGSLATGIALREPTGADDAVLIGSPGVDAQTAADLAVPVGHVFVGEATGDTVADLAWFGRDPSDSRFDAVPLPVDGGVDPETGKSMTESRGHSKYFETGSESLRNMALVAVGESHRLTVPGRSAGTPP